MWKPIPRSVLPELLDQLPPDNPLALRSRRDLRRIHVLMRTEFALRSAIDKLRLDAPPQRILELGCGDGSLLLKLARKMAVDWPGVELSLLDRHDLVTPETRRAFLDIGWRISLLKEDVLDWARAPPRQTYDVCLATLFLHHFDTQQLSEILAAVAARTNAFIACEPRRDPWTRLGSRMVALIGGNRVTREDAVTSVAAGFTGSELTLAWPNTGATWRIEELRSFPFTHRFSAVVQCRLGDGTPG